MMKIYRKWDYDLIVSTALGAADSIGISLNDKDKDRIEQMVRRFCERTNSKKNDSSFMASYLYVVVGQSVGCLQLVHGEAIGFS